MHAAFLNVRGKMSKSKGNFLTVQTLVNSGYDPLAYRYLCLQAHYRSELELAWEWADDDRTKGRAESLDTAAASLKRLYERVARTDDEPLADDTAFASARDEVLAAFSDDLNVPKAVGILHSHGSPRLWRTFDPILGLDFATKAVAAVEEEAPAEIWALVEERQAARKARDFARADALRNEIAEKGWEVGDSPTGPTLKKRG